MGKYTLIHFSFAFYVAEKVVHNVLSVLLKGQPLLHYLFCLSIQFLFLLFFCLRHLKSIVKVYYFVNVFKGQLLLIHIFDFDGVSKADVRMEDPQLLQFDHSLHDTKKP